MPDPAKSLIPRTPTPLYPRSSAFHASPGAPRVNASRVSLTPNALSPQPLSPLHPRSRPAATLGTQPLPFDCFLCRPRHRFLNSFALLETLSLRGAETLPPRVPSPLDVPCERRGGEVITVKTQEAGPGEKIKAVIWISSRRCASELSSNDSSEKRSLLHSTREKMAANASKRGSQGLTTTTGKYN
nr:PREDICTED: uncharacterized protein LOC103557555 isoform X2 [Equus przewalskii]